MGTPQHSTKQAIGGGRESLEDMEGGDVHCGGNRELAGRAGKSMKVDHSTAKKLDGGSLITAAAASMVNSLSTGSGATADTGLHSIVHLSVRHVPGPRVGLNCEREDRRASANAKKAGVRLPASFGYTSVSVEIEKQHKESSLSESAETTLQNFTQSIRCQIKKILGRDVPLHRFPTRAFRSAVQPRWELSLSLNPVTPAFNTIRHQHITNEGKQGLKNRCHRWMPP
ncbi:hypothetical protein B0T20DRAFT_393844 [Sordaria brevicollis]|uniref:Uncharacterized protein n=1 Tax=Sordaria brevicollis TaxID=83679 RepID=A0AAE0PDX6_SORBR|nr:hypothetical protein B0T20DRAFT_393844 [Sordaria brevicollis]